MIDCALAALYVAAILLSREAIVPAIAFGLTIIATLFNADMLIQHSIFIMTYILLIPLATVRVAWGMLASSIVNLLACFYFVLPIRLENYVEYFVAIMLVVNLYILFTIMRGIRDGRGSTVDNLVCVGLYNIYSFQAHSEKGKRR